MEAAVLVCGLGRVGRRVVEFLAKAGVRVVVIDTQEDHNHDLPKDVAFFTGDCRKPDVLEKAGIREVTGVLVVTSDDLVNISTALLVRQLNPTCRVVVRMFNQNLINSLGGAIKNTTALSVSALTAPFLAMSALTGDALGIFPTDDGPQQILEIPITEGSPLSGRKLLEVHAENGWLVIDVKKASGEVIRWEGLTPGLVLRPGDSLVACGSVDSLSKFHHGDDDDGFSVLWAGRIRRFLRTARRTLAAVDLPVKLGFGALFVTLILGSLVFWIGMETSLPDGLYQTVTIVATGADMQGNGRAPWAKVFISLLKILGMGIVAGFTAIVTQYLVRTKLGGAFEVGKIPEQGHVVVCGLGNVGFRVVEELLKLGRPVVVIELASDNPYAATVRRMGVPVIAGDATVPAVLKQARCETARAVVSASDSELVNLEIALLIREINPKQRVVVRLNDSHFAEAVRDAANIKLALAIPALAAPAFAAALFGDRVQSLMGIHGQTFAILTLTVTPEDKALPGLTLEKLMSAFHALPLAVSGLPPFGTTGIPMDYALKPTDTLTVLIDLAEVERLLRRELPKG
ncbi:MAG: potassium channel family protein [Fimbriiglobus sp.]